MYSSRELIAGATFFFFKSRSTYKGRCVHLKEDLHLLQAATGLMEDLWVARNFPGPLNLTLQRVLACFEGIVLEEKERKKELL